jgi:MFS family permease
LSLPDDPVRRRSFLIVFAALMTIAAGGNALVTVMPAIGREIGVSDTLIAAIFSLSAVAWTLTSPWWAAESDRRGRKALMLIGLWGFVVSMALFGLVVMAGLAGIGSALLVFAGLLVTRGVYGVFGSATAPAAQAYVADRTAREERTGALALLASAFGLGTIVGPALAPFFVLPGLGLAGPMLIFAALGGGAAYAVWRYLPSGDVVRGLDGKRPTKAERPSLAIWRDRRVAPFLLYGYVVGSCQALNTQVLGFHVIDTLAMEPVKAQAFIGIAMFAGAAATLVAQWGLIRILNLGSRDLLRWGAGLAIVGNLMTALAPGYFSVVIGFAILSLGYGFFRPGFTAGASLAVGPAEQGSVAGAVAAVNGACWLIAPVLGVALYEQFPRVVFVVNALVLLMSLGFAIFQPALKRAGQLSPAAAEVKTGLPT